MLSRFIEESIGAWCRPLGAALFFLVAMAWTQPMAATEPEAATADVLVPKTTTATSGPTLFLIGDSTMSDKPVHPANPERGWGQLLPTYFKEDLRIENHAANGRSSKSFRDEGRWKTVQERLKPGDFVIVQFGHNDQKIQSSDRYTGAFGTFTENLARYVSETRQAGAHPILATSIVRRKFDSDGQLIDTLTNYVAAIRELAPKLQIPLLDLNRSSAELVQRMGPERSKQLFKWTEPGDYPEQKEAFKDDTHLNAFGASRVCDLAVVELRTKVPDLAKWLK